MKEGDYMEALQAYFDGNTVKTLGNVKLKKNQKLIITVLDEFLDDVPKKETGKSARGILSKYANNDLLEEENTAWEKAVAEKKINGYEIKTFDKKLNKLLDRL